MKIQKWNDGYRLEGDPRHEDPLYYYLKEDDWGSAIGFQIDPLYEERRSANVTIQVFSKHALREASMEPPARKVMYCRVLPCLVGRHPQWQHVTLQSNYFNEFGADGALAGALCELGFSSDQYGMPAPGPVWRRTVPARAVHWRKRWASLRRLFAGE